MSVIKHSLRAACGLSLFFSLSGLMVLAPFAQAAPASENLKQTFVSATSDSLKQLKDPAVALTIVSRDQILLNHVQGMQAEATVPLGRISELFAALMVLKQLEQGKYPLDEPINYLLDGYAVSEPFGPVTVRHLLERSSGLPLREAGIYTSLPSKTPKLIELLKQDLKPTVTAPGQSISSTSFAELLIGQLAERTGQQALPELIKTQLLKPLGLTEVKLPDAKAVNRTLPGQDSLGYLFPRLNASAREIHDWQAQPDQLAPLLQALLGKHPQVISPKLRQQLLSRSLKRGENLPTSSLGLLEGELLGQRYFYLDSDWFGHSSRLAVFPEQDLAFFLHYNSSSAQLKETWTKQLIQTVIKPKAKASTSAASASWPESSAGGEYGLTVRDTNSLLKVLDLFNHTELNVSDTLSWSGAIWKRQSDQLWTDADGRLLELKPDGELTEGFDQHRSFKPVEPWRRMPVQLVLAGLFCLFFLSVLVRSLRFLSAYESPFEANMLAKLSADAAEAQEIAQKRALETNTETRLETKHREIPDAVLESEPSSSERSPSEMPTETEPEVESVDIAEAPAHAGWDIPMLGAVISVLGMLFTAGIRPVTMQTGLVGDQLSFVMRNDPNGWLLAWLAMPLFALIGSLILLALLSVEWKQRPWQKLEKWHYLTLILVMPFWAAWLANWNILGFRF